MVVSVLIITNCEESTSIEVDSLQDSLQSKVDTLIVIKDSIQHRIDTINVTIKEVYDQYEENFSTIINNDVNEDYIFFCNYIELHRTRFDSINNL